MRYSAHAHPLRGRRLGGYYLSITNEVGVCDEARPLQRVRTIPWAAPMPETPEQLHASEVWDDNLRRLLAALAP